MSKSILFQQWDFRQDSGSFWLLRCMNWPLPVSVGWAEVDRLNGRWRWSYFGICQKWWGENLDDCKTIVQNKPDADSSLGNNGGNAFWKQLSSLCGVRHHLDVLMFTILHMLTHCSDVFLKLFAVHLNLIVLIFLAGEPKGRNWLPKSE